MGAKIIRLVHRTKFDFSNLTAGTTITELPVIENVDVSQYGSGTLIVRVHERTLPQSSYIRLDLRAVAPSREDPASFFRGPRVATLRIMDSVVEPSFATARLAANVGVAVSLFLSVTQTTAGTCRFTISVDLALRESVEAWTPDALGSTVKLWLDQRDQVLVDGGVSNWGDESLSGAQDFEQVTSTKQPAGGRVLNGFEAPDFDGTDDRMSSTALSNFVSANAYHGFAVIRADAIVGSDAWAFYNDGIVADVGAGWWGLFLKNNAGALEVQAFHWDSGYRVATAGGFALDTDVLIEWSYDGTTLRVRIGDGAVATAAGGGSIGNLTNPVYLGSSANNVNLLNGMIASVVVCDSHLSETEVSNMRQYLSSKYGVLA